MATYPRAGASEVPAQPDFPELERRALAYWNAHDTFKQSHREPGQEQRVRLLRRPAVRQRAPALRPPADRLRQGHRAALQDHARRQGRPKVRLGLSRPARRGRGRTAAWHLRQGRHPQDGHRDLQRGLPRLRAPLHQGVGGVRHQAGPLGRLRERLQDARPPLHGERHVGVQAAARQGPDLPGLQGAALLLAVRDPAVQPRAADGRRRLRGPHRPVRHRPVQAGDRRVDPRLDHHAVDAAVQPGRRGRPGHHVRDRGDRRTASATSWPRTASRPTRRNSPGQGRSPRSRAANCSAAATSRCSTSSPTREKYETENAWRVIPSDEVTTEDGTGVVHMAPAYGEADAAACQAAGIPIVLTVNEQGKYLPMITGLGRPARLRGEQADRQAAAGRPRPR